MISIRQSAVVANGAYDSRGNRLKWLTYLIIASSDCTYSTEIAPASSPVRGANFNLRSSNPPAKVSGGRSRTRSDRKLRLFACDCCRQGGESLLPLDLSVI